MIAAADIPLFARPFYFLRHGETTANLYNTLAGSLDVELTPLGHEQAQNAARRLQHAGITDIHSSDLQRARLTAEYVGGVLGLDVHLVPALRERSWGVMEGQSRTLRRKGDLPEGAETTAEYMARVLSGCASIKPGALPLLVAHSGVYRVLCRTLKLHDPEEPVENCLPIRFVPTGDNSWAQEPLCAL